jgi:hypothetical protein
MDARVGMAVCCLAGAMFAAPSARPSAKLQQQAPTAAAMPASAGANLAVQLHASLASLADALAGLDPGQLHLPAAERSALADSQASVAQNLRVAAPGLLDAFAAAPSNLGAAFRLYRDLSAVLAVAQRSTEMLPRRDADAAQPVAAAAAAVSRDLDALGGFIEARGQADYARRRQVTAHAAQPAAATAPKTLVIGDANGAKPPAKKKIPH